MMRSGDQALDQALACHRAPGNLAAIRQLDLPEDLLTLLRIAAGDSEATLQAAQLTDESPEALREVAIFYLQQLLFADDGDSYRTLGVNPEAGDEQIKLNYRWLVRWLHPDRNPDGWETVFADRVNRAWQDLRTSDRRAAYDLDRQTADRLPPADHGNGGMVIVAVPEAPEPLLSSRAMRWLPAIALGGVSLCAVIALVLLHQSQVMDRETIAAAMAQPATGAVHDGWVSTRTVAAIAAPTVAASTAIAPIEPAATGNMAIGSGAAAMTASAANANPITTAPPGAAIESPPQAFIEPASKPRPAPPIADANQPVVRNRMPDVGLVPAVVTRTKALPDTPILAKSERMLASAPRPVAASKSRHGPDLDAPAPDEVTSLQSAQSNRPAVIADQQAASGLIDDRIAAALVSRFSQAYADGDTRQLMQLFTHDAQNNRGDRRTIAADYRHLFKTSERRRIALRDMSWLNVGDSATIIASFETEVVPRGQTRGERVTGDIRFDLRQEDGELRIYRLRHDNRRI